MHVISFSIFVNCQTQSGTILTDVSLGTITKLLKHLFLTVLEVRRSNIKVLVDLVAGENFFLYLEMAAFFLYPYMAFPGYIPMEKARALSSSSYKGMNPIIRVPPLSPHLKLIIAQSAHLQKPFH